MASTITFMADESSNQQQPVVVKQGGNGIGLVLAALIVAGAVVYAINVWSTTKKETAPGKNLQQGIERIKEGVDKAIEQRD
ncbi:hypothetical protein KR49_02795 [Synechococcus sp. KORDI-49]|jgi:hypothetical protein|uniref:hypothetical protein n=2 Tax=Synechococcales TaxID=1890424 RepID=UPI0004E084DA|nr:hypothetical protein [Synechococcus sp. KORDI-49]AII45391.1 hypothetical protein KR49_02795 [Synechococcus sp. KORDI-49]|tara:strand:- start:768 stop:1010 length:243 start_codon:yes stop_codon:yes gene_type:complete